MNAHITAIIQYYLAFNSDWLFACYFVIILSLVATAVCYSSIVISYIIFIGTYMAALRLDYTITQSRPTQSHKVLSLKVVNTKTNKRVFKSVSPCI